MTALARMAPAPAPIDDLVRLAQSRSLDDRQRLLLGVTALCEAAGPEGRASQILGEIFLGLTRQAEREIRLVLSQRLAAAEWAPPALVNMLALDEIEIARPIIAASPVLKDDDLLRLIIEASLEHQIEVARRPHLSGRVADAIIDRGEPATLTALAHNSTADVGAEAMRRLVEHSRRYASLRLPLTRHPRMTEGLARQLHQWVGSALRESIGSRFRVDEVRLAGEIEAAVSTVMAGRARGETVVDTPERDEMERRLVDKLQAAGQLRPGFLIRAVRERRLALFRHSLAALAALPVPLVDWALRQQGAKPLYLACAAAGVDRAAFPSLLRELRMLNDGRPGSDEEAVWTQAGVAPEAAAKAFRGLAAAAAAV